MSANLRRVFRQVAFLLLLPILPAVVAGVFHPKRPSWKSDEVSLSTTQAWGSTVIWIDARSRDHFEAEHIPGALWLSEDDWDGGISEVLSAWSSDKRVVVYCSSLSCQTSHEVAKRLREEAGLPEVYVLQGGWENWKGTRR